MSPPENVWDLNRFEYYGAKAAEKDLFEKGYVDVAVMQPTYLYEFYKDHGGAIISFSISKYVNCLIEDNDNGINLYLKDIPVSKNLKRLIDLKIIKKISSISHGDDYQILFTASPSKSRIIEKTSRSLGIKVSKIGKICNHYQKSQIFDEKNEIITLKNKGYFHKF